MSHEKTNTTNEPAQCHFETGKTYAWCTCGKSDKQPYCNGAHAGTSLRPIVIKADKDQSVWLCRCKKTKNPPYCDGSHRHS